MNSSRWTTTACGSNQTIWAQMSAADLVELREIAQQRIEAYYEGVE
jgi:hypothetical protein